MPCKHQKQKLEPSQVAAQIKYPQRSTKDLASAAGVTPENITSFNDKDYPAPLILPNDDIDFDPKYPAQSFSDWKSLVDSIKVPAQRKKIYVAAPPGYTKAGYRLHLALWPKAPAFVPPKVGDVMEYLEAFYHGLEIVELPKEMLTFDAWTEWRKKEASNSFVALNTPKESIRVRKRPQPKGGFGVQLNLNDMLDAAVAVLPTDALALLLLVHHDMYEDEEDDFACGRAYGGSHVCVVSSYRYSPIGETEAGVDREHIWPASHCAKFVDDYTGLFIEKPKRKRKRSPVERASSRLPSIPLAKAIEAQKLIDWSKRETIMSHWFSRVCRTASHELGHCLGMDHCMYYACIMQGTASVPEDLRQPPYLCPVDEAKVSSIIAQRGTAEEGSAKSREKTLLNFTKKHEVGGGFTAFRAWLEARLAKEE